MSAANTDLLRKVSRRWVGQIGSGGVSDASVTTIPLSSTTNLPTATAVSVVIDRVDANGVATPTLEETVIGVVSSTNLVTCVRGEEGTAQAHDAGAVVEVLMTANMWGDLVDWGVTEHNQDGTHSDPTLSACTDFLVEHNTVGTHKTATVTTLKATGAEINTGTEDGKIVTPKAILDANILSQAWTAWTPSWGNLSVGNGTLVARYTRIGKTVLFEVKLTFGSTTSISGTVTFSFPVTAYFTASLILGACRLSNTGTASTDGKVILSSNTTGTLYVNNTDSAYLGITALSSSVPHTWAETDVIGFTGFYEAV